MIVAPDVSDVPATGVAGPLNGWALNGWALSYWALNGWALQRLRLQHGTFWCS